VAAVGEGPPRAASSVWLVAFLALLLLLLLASISPALLRPPRAPSPALRGYDETIYARLRVQVNATSRDIRKAYMKLCIEWHPDKRPKEEDPKISHEIFKGIKAAYEILVDPATRAIYDRTKLPELMPQLRSRPPQKKAVKDVAPAKRKAVETKNVLTQRELRQKKIDGKRQRIWAQIANAQLRELDEKYDTSLPPMVAESLLGENREPKMTSGSLDCQGVLWGKQTSRGAG